MSQTILNVKNQKSKTYTPDKNSKGKIQNSKLNTLTYLVFCLLFFVFNLSYAQVIPIAEAIADADSNGIPDLRNQYVTVTGIVTVPSGVFSRTRTDIYVQDNTAGVNVFNFSYIPTSLGDSVIVSGQVYFYRGKTEISNASITIVAHNRPLPEPLPLTCAMINREPYEGSLVKLTGVFTTAFLLAGDQNYNLIDNSGSCVMRIYKDTDIPGLIVVQDTFTVIGIKSQYTTDTIPPVNTGYQLLPRFRTDFSRNLNDALPLMTIAEVQRPGPDGYSSAYEGQYVRVRGRITGPAYIFTSGSSKSLFIQDATNGINVYAPLYADTATTWLDSCGTEWEVIGKVTEYNGLTEIANGVMMLLDKTIVPISPVELPFNTPITEGMESKLIKVTGPIIAEPSQAGAGQNFTIKNGTPGITIRVLNTTNIPINQFQKNKNFQIVGIVGQYTTSSPFNTGYQVMPRFNSDIIDLTSTQPPAEIMRIDTVYPNPFSRRADDPLLQSCLIRINSPQDYRLYLEIFDMEGRSVKKLLTNQPGGYYELRWDGTNQNAEPLPIGIYILNLKGITPQGKQEFVRKPIVIGTKL
ncbi:MAG: FlgD immunoglobulin-like domain containing protein [candidate division WOR-3 bacterium]